MTMRAHERETIGGVPFGLSRDYAHLPVTGPLRSICCPYCTRMYEDAERLMEDGCRVQANMCEQCREDGRLKWIAEKLPKVELPRAVAAFRGSR